MKQPAERSDDAAYAEYLRGDPKFAALYLLDNVTTGTTRELEIALAHLCNAFGDGSIKHDQVAKVTRQLIQARAESANTKGSSEKSTMVLVAEEIATIGLSFAIQGISPTESIKQSNVQIAIAA